MGRKQIGKRQCFYVFIACLTVAICTGCATFSGIKTKMAAQDHLKQGQLLFEQGAFRDAVEEHQRVLALIHGSDPADRALFNLGLIYAHQDNPDRNYVTSAALFKRILDEYPDSPLYNQAHIWYYLLNANMKSRIHIDELSRINGYLLLTDELITIKDFKKALDVNQKALSISENTHRFDEILFNIGLIYAHHENPGKNFRISVSYFERLIKEYPESPLVDQARAWKGLLDIIEKSKQVDIEIDQKKKELAR